MSKRLLLEGTDLEALIVRVHGEIGPTAKVVKAERVRTGGVAGFFAKERFELTVEVPDEVAYVPGPLVTPGSRGPAGSAGGGSAGGGSVGTVPGSAARWSGGDDAARRAEVDAGTAEVQPVGIDALLAAADAADRHGAPRGESADDEIAPVSTEQDTFASILDSVRQLASETRQADEAAAAAAASASAGPATGLGAAAAASGGTAAAGAAAFGAAATGGPVSAAPTPPVAPPLGQTSARRSNPWARKTAPSGPTPVVLDKEVRPAEFVVVRTTGASIPELLQVGVPRRLLSELPAGQGTYPLSQVLSRVPRAPAVVREPASVVVVAGQGEQVVEAARLIARRIGVPDSGIALAGRLDPQTGYGPWVITGMSARRLRAATVESEAPLVVALGVGADASDWTIASSLVASFDPDQVWAVVEADRSLADARRWMTAVGQHRPFDALAARNVSSTSQPAAILELGVPVGLLDGFAASALVWAALLDEHLDDPTWD